MQYLLIVRLSVVPSPIAYGEYIEKAITYTKSDGSQLRLPLALKRLVGVCDKTNFFGQLL